MLKIIPNKIFLIIVISLACVIVFTQEIVEIESGISIENSNNPSPEPGTIQWNGTDLVGWNGVIWVSLTGNASVGSVTDVDGNLYPTIRIGEQEWMAKNLQVTKFRGHTLIDQITNPIIWEGLDNTMSPAWCWYNNDGVFAEDRLGKLYNWYAVDGDSICPAGWHIPTSAEWHQLAIYLGGSSTAGSKMKQTGSPHWLQPSLNGTNESGFSGLGGGYRDDNGQYLSYQLVGQWWSSNDAGVMALSFRLRDATNDLFTLSHDKRTGFSIRCIKD